MCMFIIAVEFSPSRSRGMVGAAIWIFGPIVYSSIALFAYFIREWRHLMLLGATLGIPVMVYIW